MNELKKLMPEQFYTLDNTMSLEKILRAKDSKDPIIGKVVFWNSNSKQLEVELGNQLQGILPIDDASIYPALSCDGCLTPSIRYLIGKTIVATVKDVDLSEKTPIITLSRKDSMLSAFKVLSDSIDKKIDCCITGFAPYGVFVDVGYGLSGLIYCRDLCIPRVNHYSELGINIGDKITAKVISSNNFQFSLNYKDEFENKAHTLNPGDLIIVSILKRLNEYGYFAYINPNTSAVVDVPNNVSCKYGDKVLARVKGQRSNNPSQLRLTFVSFR